jgi:hypothetical protein
MPIPRAKDSSLPLNQNEIRLVCGINRLLDAMPNSILAVSISPKLYKYPPIAKRS